jgi:hypothetical protein
MINVRRPKSSEHQPTASPILRYVAARNARIRRSPNARHDATNSRVELNRLTLPIRSSAIPLLNRRRNLNVSVVIPYATKRAHISQCQVGSLIAPRTRSAASPMFSSRRASAYWPTKLESKVKSCPDLLKETPRGAAVVTVEKIVVATIKES